MAARYRRLNESPNDDHVERAGFKGAHFPDDIILMGVRWYVAYPLSYRHVEELMEERGVPIDHATIQRWVVQDSPQLEEAFHRRKRAVWVSWRMDETSIKIKGQWYYLYRAVDKTGQTRHCSRDSECDMDRPGDRFYTTGPHLFPQGSQGCLDRVHMYQIRRRGLSTSRTSQHLTMCRTAGTRSPRPAHDAPHSPLATKPDSAPDTTWAICPPDVRLIFW
jgi:hypothetical protein